MNPVSRIYASQSTGSQIGIAFGALRRGEAYEFRGETHVRDEVDYHLFITCESLDSGFTDAGTTVGNVWLYDTLDGPDRYRHEARHADQWAMVGPSFPVLYGAEFVRTGGRQQNVFEEWAGLHDGGYLR